MARKKSVEAIDAEIAKTQSLMTKVQERYNKLADKIEALQEEKRRLQADEIMEAYLKSGKSYEEIMTFLKP